MKGAGTAFIVPAAFCWGISGGIGGILMDGGWDPFVVSFYRGSIGLLFVLVWLILRPRGSGLGSRSLLYFLFRRKGSIYLEGEQILKVLSEGAMANPMFAVKGPMVLNNDVTTSFPLKHQLKDLKLAVNLGNQLRQDLPVTTSVQRVFQKAMDNGFGDEDIAAVAKVIYTQDTSETKEGVVS